MWSRYRHCKGIWGCCCIGAATYSTPLSLPPPCSAACLHRLLHDCWQWTHIPLLGHQDSAARVHVWIWAELHTVHVNASPPLPPSLPSFPLTLPLSLPSLLSPLSLPSFPPHSLPASLASLTVPLHRPALNRYSDLSLHPSQVGPSEKVYVSVNVTNTGTLDAQEVAQLYVQVPSQGATLPTPRLALQGVQKYLITAQRSRIVTFELTPYQFST